MEGLTAEEAAVYDRQLRVWGVEAQQLLRKSRVLVLGCEGGAAEVAKNLVLAGVGYLILVDDKRVFEQTNGSFLIPHGTAGDTFASEASVHSLRDMNPLVEVESDGRSPLSFVAEEGVSGYDVVIGSNLPSNYIAALDASCSEAKVPFCSSNCRGVSGFVFSNPQEHEYIIEKSVETENGEIRKTNEKHVVKGKSFVESLKEFPEAHPRRKSPLLESIPLLVAFELENNRSVAPDDYAVLIPMLSKVTQDPKSHQALGSYITEGDGIPPVLAVIGGILANDIIKILSRKGEPSIQNVFMYSIVDDAGWIEQGGYRSTKTM